jgi:adenosylhomocysteine nucleosidase
MNNAPVTELINNASVLFVFALESEAAEAFGDCSLLFTGIGKVNAAFHLTRRIFQQKPALIVNMGSAGSNAFKRGEVVCCSQFLQRDMDVTGLGFRKYETPLSGQEPLLQYGLKLHGLPEGICGTGDSFEMAHGCPDYNVLDMEAYPLAWIARQENIPFLCLKYISDGADGMAAEHWTEQVHYAAVAFRKIIDRLTTGDM